MIKQETSVKQPVKLPISIRRKLERLAQAKHMSMNDVIVSLIDAAPDPRGTKQALRE